MNSPAIWILLPGVVGSALFLLQRRRTFVTVIGTLFALTLGLLAIIAPFGEIIQIGPVSLDFQTSMVLFGRRFIIDYFDRYTLALIYVGLAFWFAGALVGKAHRFFVPLGLITAALLTSALSVEPFFYAALLIELMVLVSIPMISPPGSESGRGVLRYVTFQTFGFPLILFTSWLLSGVTSGSTDEANLQLAILLLAFGFVFLLGIFPFHTWIPMLSRESHPYVVAFLLYELPLVIMLFALGFLLRYEWLQITPGVYTLTTMLGCVMIMIGGSLAAFQRSLTGLLGYSVMVEIGLSLIAISMGLSLDGREASLSLFFALLPPRAISLGVWALALIVISRNNPSRLQGESHPSGWELSFREVNGAGRQYPIAASCLLLAQFSLAGLPLLAGFPTRIAIWDWLAQQSLLITGLVLVGYAGLLIAGIRTMAVLVTGQADTGWKINEQRSENVLLVLGGITLIVLGLFPQIYTPAMSNVAEVFMQFLP